MKYKLDTEKLGDGVIHISTAEQFRIIADLSGTKISDEEIKEALHSYSLIASEKLYFDVKGKCYQGFMYYTYGPNKRNRFEFAEVVIPVE